MCDWIILPCSPSSSSSSSSSQGLGRVYARIMADWIIILYLHVIAIIIAHHHHRGLEEVYAGM
jgi:hypothetical protein